jgi:hypothetical protein
MRKADADIPSSSLSCQPFIPATTDSCQASRSFDAASVAAKGPDGDGSATLPSTEADAALERPPRRSTADNRSGVPLGEEHLQYPEGRPPRDGASSTSIMEGSDTAEAAPGEGLGVIRVGAASSRLTGLSEVASSAERSPDKQQLLGLGQETWQGEAVVGGRTTVGP